MRDDLMEIRIHGRGGQGNVVAAYLLAEAAIAAQFFAQAFPFFGAERRGAPVTAFVRFSKSPFKRRSAIECPQALIIQDPHLLNLTETMHGFDANGTLVINSGRKKAAPPHHAAGKVIAFPATEMAEEILGRPIPNVALVAAFMGALNIFPIDGLEKALERRFPKAVAEKNIALARKCYQLGGELYASP
jgi:pyruvate ferredoxin oxidoreductase gamma subunit